MMILLSGHSLAEAGIVGEEALSVSLSERESSAQLTPERMDGITVNSWLKSVRGPGAGTVWKVRSIEQIYNTRTPVVQLEHVIGALKDQILFGEITPAVITGNASATTCTALQAVNYILARSSDWTLGTMDSAYQSVTNAYRFNGDSLFDALGTVTETLEDAWWSYDLTVYPFLLNITAKPAGVACELRAGRNLRALSRTVDRTGMYTRFYPIGHDDLHITGEYVSKNESTYGRIDHVETDTNLTTEAQLTAWANRRLAKHAEPKVSITADGLELADATGVPLDRLRLGRICRMPLPEFGTVIEERIVELSYQDAAHRPEEVRITMANTKEDVTTILAEAIKSGSGTTGSAAREGARQSKDDHAWIEDTDTRVALVVGTNSGGNYIKAGEIALAINSSTGQSTATINADHILIGNQNAETVINGKITADDITTTFLSGKIADIPLVTCKAIVCQGAVAASGSVSGDIVAAGTTFALNGNSCTDLIKSASVSGNTLTLTYLSGATVNFNKAGAVTVDSITAPAAAAGTEVTSTTVTATASNGATKTATLSLSKGTPSASGGYAAVRLGNTVVGRISIGNWWDAGRDSVTVSTISAPAGGTSQTATLTATASNGATKTRNIYVTNGGFADGGIYAQAKLDDSNGSIIARQWISLPASATWWHEWNGNNISVSCTVGGKSYSISFAHGM